MCTHEYVLFSLCLGYLLVVQVAPLTGRITGLML